MKVIDVPGLKPARKHSYVLEQFGVLTPGESIFLKDDHDPRSLYYQMVAVLGEVFDWKYMKRGPRWEVLIRKLDEGEKPPTIGQLAATGSSRIAVFRKYNIDFCCGGKQTLHQACMEKGLDVKKVEDELTRMDRESPQDPKTDFNGMKLNVLCDHIEFKHHEYVRRSILEIETLIAKMVEEHGRSHVHLADILASFRTIADEMSMHMQKEEMVLYPYIRELQANMDSGSAIPKGRFPP